MEEAVSGINTRRGLGAEPRNAVLPAGAKPVGGAGDWC